VIREYQAGDLEALKRMHAAMGFSYALPDPDGALVVVKQVAVDAGGRVAMAALLRLTTESYLLVDGERKDAREKWKMFCGLHESVRQRLMALGLEDAHAFLPPNLPKAFDRRLKKLGWTEEKWRCWWREAAR
jgi:hypothetical protein